MKRFFSRFSTGGATALPNPQSPSSQDQEWEREKPHLTHPLPSTDRPPSSTPYSSHSTSGRRVKTLAAKYEAQSRDVQDTPRSTRSPDSAPIQSRTDPGETISAPITDTIISNAPPSDSPIPSLPPTFETSDTTPPPVPSKSRAALATLPPHSLPRRMPGSSLPEKQDPQRQSIDRDALNDQRKVSKEQQRQPSGSSQASGGTASGPKTVAFAPSPEKPSAAQVTNTLALRPSSPHNAGLSRANTTETSSRLAGQSTDTFLTNNFARPTAASQARARSSGRHSGSDFIIGAVSGSSNYANDRTLHAAPRSVKMGRANSLNTSSRRSSGTGVQDGPAVAISSPTAMGHHSTASTSSLGHSYISGKRQSLEANSIPFASAFHGHLIHRTSSPMSASGHGSVAMQLTNSGTGSARPDSISRRGSMTPNSVGSWREGGSFPFGSIGSKTMGVPSWSEMTQEELVHNLGPRERTRQEVLWEIVASEERYVIELEKVKELYIEALLHPDQFDPERLLSQPQFPASDDPNHSHLQTDSPEIIAPQPIKPKRHSMAAQEAGGASQHSQELPIAARFMSTTSAAYSGDGSASANSAYPQRPDSAAQHEADRQRAAGARSPYSAGLLGMSQHPTGSANSSQENKRSSIGLQRPGSGHGAFGANSRTSLAYGLGLGLGPAASPAPQGPELSNVRPGLMRPTRATTVSRGLSKVQKLRSKSKAAGQGDPLILTVPLPRSLKLVLEAISEGLVEAHALLSEALKARYEEQWPLVRSLADVFMKHSYILQHYASYVCHLQRALEELEEAALMERALRGKKLKQERLSHTVGLGRTVCALEAAALERGHGGLSIFISMPFQRLLKYPLLFQNLLFHTDPSTHEFESTVSMVVEVERLVRSIEDEKVNAEERDRTRDVFARIEGLSDRQVLRPRPDRVLIEEKALYDENARRTMSESAPKDGGNTTDASDNEGAGSGSELASGPKMGSNKWNSSPGLKAALRSKRSYRRLSDFLSSEDKGSSPSKAPNMGSKKDLWLVRFSDVEIKCQRVGVTALPMVSSAALTTSSGEVNSPDLVDAEVDFARRSKESKERLKALRNTTLRAKTRNLYRFISVVAWRNAARQSGAGQDEGGLEGLPTSHEVEEEDEEDEEGGDSSDEDGAASIGSSTSSSNGEGGGFIASDRYVRQSKLSFSYWGDKIEPRLAGNSDAVTASSVAAYRARGSQHLRGRLNEPLSASSIHAAPEPMQNAVAQMHTRGRNDKFGARLRPSQATAAAAATATASADHVSTAALASSMAVPRRQVSRP